ncbi:MAG: hydantoinase/oxoprolinase N-terminal domain-containing protein, partial [Pseudomonadota bacterium]|nr:hydantoinase/oxoprolinase N-terminal domain-containing protein [Pseudomonadota bacterium]MEC7246503.1 hydantoinase/oxoprolinase N-terminal domain-containing protein [Pseudomonadota bacterium]
MPLILGLDTGGTFTDAALLDAENRQVVAHAKSLTTRHDLSVGVGAAMAEALAVFGGNSADIRLVSLSTTLATNAVVESVGGASCLILIGFDNNILSRAGLQEALGAEPYFAIAGGHKPDGRPQTSLDVAGLMKAIEAVRGRVSSFAVASHFATRNPEHERQARDILREQTGLPVSCSFELSSALGGPRRALTTLLNARLISLLDRLVRATEAQMAHLGLDCPLMV